MENTYRKEMSNYVLRGYDRTIHLTGQREQRAERREEESLWARTQSGYYVPSADLTAGQSTFRGAPVVLPCRNGTTHPSSWHWRGKRKEQVRLCRLWTENGEEGGTKRRTVCSMQGDWASCSGQSQLGAVERKGEEKERSRQEGKTHPSWPLRWSGGKGKARRRGRGLAPRAGGAGRRWREVVNRPRSAASPGMAVTPDWELGERVGGLLKQPDPGWTPRLHARIAACPLITHSCW